MPQPITRTGLMAQVVRRKGAGKALTAMRMERTKHLIVTRHKRRKAFKEKAYKKLVKMEKFRRKWRRRREVMMSLMSKRYQFKVWIRNKRRAAFNMTVGAYKLNKKMAKMSIRMGEHAGLKAIGKLTGGTQVNRDRAAAGLPPVLSLEQKLCLLCMNTTTSFCYACWCPCLKYRQKKEFSWETTPLCRKGTYYNLLLRKVIAFAFGLCLPLPLFIVAVYGIDLQIERAGFYVGVLAFIFSFGMSISIGFQCAVILTCMNLIASKVRILIFCLTLYFVYMGPISNIRANCDLMSNSWGCTQDVAANSTDSYVKSGTEPLKDLMNSLASTLGDLTVMGFSLRVAFSKVKIIFNEIYDVLKGIYDWFVDTRGSCNKLIGVPYNRCLDLFGGLKEQCQEGAKSITKNEIVQTIDFGGWLSTTVNTVASWGCDVVVEFKFVCEVVKLLDVLCILLDAVKKFVASTSLAFLSSLLDRLWLNFFFKLEFEHDFYYNVTMTKPYGQMLAEFQEQIQYRFWYLTRIASVAQYALGILLIMIVAESARYLYNFMYYDNFDNIYISKDFVRIDTNRKEQGKPTVLPLLDAEQKEYLVEYTIRSRKNLKGFLRRFCFWMNVCAGVGAFVGLDFAVFHCFKLMSTGISAFHISDIMKNIAVIHVSGKGIMANIYRQIVGQFDTVNKPQANSDVNHCIPDYLAPNMEKNIRVSISLAFIILSCFLQGFINAFRHNICQFYYPSKKKTRAVALYSRILRQRVPLIKHKYDSVQDSFNRDKGGPKAEASLFDRMLAQSDMMSKVAECMGMGRKSCLLCGTAAATGDDSFTKCENYGCNGFYCRLCYTDLNNVCMVCNKLVLFEDEDASEEKDSSEDESRDFRPMIRLHNLHKNGEPGQHPEWAHMSRRENLDPAFPLPPIMRFGMGPGAPRGPTRAPAPRATVPGLLSASSSSSGSGGPMLRPQMPPGMGPMPRDGPPFPRGFPPRPPGMPPGMRPMPPGMRPMPPGMPPGMRPMPPGMPPGMRPMLPGMPPGMRPMPPGMRPMPPQPIPPGVRPMSQDVRRMPPVLRPSPPVVRPMPPGTQPRTPGVPPRTPGVPPMPPSMRPMPPGTRPMPPVVLPMPPSMRPMPPVMRPMPPVVLPMPPSMRPMPPVMRPMPPSLRPLPPSVRPMPPAMRPMPPSPRPVSPGKQHKPSGVPPVPPSIRAMPPGMQHMPPGMRPMPPGMRPMPPSIRPMPPSIRPMPPSMRPMSPGKQPKPPAVPAMPPNMRHMPPGMRPMPPSMRPMPLSMRPMPPGMRPMPPSMRAMPPGMRPMSPGMRPMPPGMRPMSPGKQPKSPAVPPRPKSRR